MSSANIFALAITAMNVLEHGRMLFKFLSRSLVARTRSNEEAFRRVEFQESAIKVTFQRLLFAVFKTTKSFSA